MSEWLTSLRLRLRAFVRGRRLERDLADEMAFHLAMRADQLRTAGAADAERLARRRFGNVARIGEDLRETWAVAPRAAAVLRDLRYAARTLRRSPAFAGAVVLTLGLGIGANTAFFTVVNAVLIRPLGYADAEALVSVHEAFPRARLDRLPFSPLDFEDFRSYQRSFASVAAYRSVPLEVSGGGRPESIAGTRVSAGLFGTLGVAPMIGRTFSPADDRPGVNVAILSWGLWQRRYGAHPSIVGQAIQLDRRTYTVVGVMPAAFVFPRRGAQFNDEPADVWIPIAFTDRERVERGSLHANSVIARLKPGVSMEAARAEIEVLSRRIAANYPANVREAGFSPRLGITPLREEISGRFEKPLLMLLAAVGLVLLVACANVANLVLSRMSTRVREFAVRTALGARHGQLVQLLVCEALVLTAAGGALGVMLAYWAVRASPAVLVRTVPNLHDLAIDVRVLAFTAVMCLATTFVFTLVRVPQVDGRKLRVQRGFVVLTVGLACVLLVAAGLFMRSFAALLSTDVGFRPAQVLTASVTLPRTFYATAASVRTFHDALGRSLRGLPGVRSVALATNLPLTAYDGRAFTAEGSAAADGAPTTTNLTWVHGPYFETFGMTLKGGRFFSPDEYAQNRRVAIVNEKLAALVWPGQDPVGRRLKWGGTGSRAPWLTVVGVIANVADGPVGSEPGVHAYEPFRQLPDMFLDGAANQFGRDVKAAVLAEGDPRALATLVRQEIAALDPDLAIESILPMDDRVSTVVAPQRFSAQLVGVFAGMALLLASVGLYGLVAFTTAQRRKEIAIRMALGAGRLTVVRMVIAQGGRLVAVGLAAGLLASLAVVRLMSSLLFRTNEYDVATFVTVPALLALAALAACAVPAWRAARTDAMTALRTE